MKDNTWSAIADLFRESKIAREQSTMYARATARTLWEDGDLAAATYLAEEARRWEVAAETLVAVALSIRDRQEVLS